MAAIARPLEQIQRETRTAHRAPHLRKKNMARTDQIDNLDNIVGAYHHDGPYDATLASRNRDKRYAPVEAVKESNMEAIRATPHERVQDSLKHHVPLYGTAEFPPGTVDTFGRVMDFNEGDNLMLDPHAEGGAYKRYDHIPYHPDDVKGKGEPSFTRERDRKDRKHGRARSSTTGGASGVYEMQPHIGASSDRDIPRTPGDKTGSSTIARQRSNSTGTFQTCTYSVTVSSSGADAGLGRSTSARKRFSSLKHGLGNLRRRHD